LRDGEFEIVESRPVRHEVFGQPSTVNNQRSRINNHQSAISMTLHINGDAREFAASLSLVELIQQLGMKQDRVAVELNRSIVPREHWAQTRLSDNDRLEIVHFVGGGGGDLVSCPY
jgi:sulfur carrier protein